MFSTKIRSDLELRLLEERHTEALFAIVDQNRDYLRQWLPWLDLNNSINDTRRFIKTALDQFANNTGLVAGIWYRDQLVGVIGYNQIDWSNRVVHIGYWLAAGFQGKGIMTSACRALVDYAFHELGLNRVDIRCATGNKRSCAIPQRLGFTQEGVLRQAEWLYDHFVDHVIYGMLTSEWKSGKR